MVNTPAADPQTVERLQAEEQARAAATEQIFRPMTRPGARQTRPGTAPSSPLHFDQMGGFGRFLVNMLLLLTSFLDPDKASNKTLIDTISKAFGFEGNTEERQQQYRDLRSDLQTRGRDEVRRERDFSKLNSSAAREALREGSAVISASGKADFDYAVDIVLRAEGGLSNHKNDRGGLTKYGISQKAHPDIDVANLTERQAVQIYKERYWDKIHGIENMSRAQALVAFDSAVNHGVGYANGLVKASKGDVATMIDRRETYYGQIVAKDQSQDVFYKGWMNRINKLAKEMTTNPETGGQITLASLAKPTAASGAGLRYGAAERTGTKLDTTDPITLTMNGAAAPTAAAATTEVETPALRQRPPQVSLYTSPSFG